MTAQLVDRPNVNWCTRAQVLALSAYSGITDLALIDRMIEVASAWLWRQTGRQFSGPGTTTVRPVAQCHGFSASMIGRSPVDWFDSRTGTYGGFGGQRGEGAQEVLLGHTPVRSVDQVVIDGTPLAVSSYRLDDARWLVRTDGLAWPAWNDWTKLSAAGGGDRTGTWEVTLTWGADPPPDGVYAAEVLAGELALAASGGSGCSLPNRVQSVVRQGTSMVLMDPVGLLNNGMWGVAPIDNFVRSANPNGLTQPATVTSPDIPRAVRRAGTLPGS